jgi:hypothetical protein
MKDNVGKLLNQAELATRWRMSHRTLEGWRWRGRGPCFLKIGGRVMYRLEDIVTYEAEQLTGGGAQTQTAAERLRKASDAHVQLLSSAHSERQRSAEKLERKMHQA